MARAQAAEPAAPPPPTDAKPAPAPPRPAGVDEMQRIHSRLNELEARAAAEDKKAAEEKKAADEKKAAEDKKAAEEKKAQAEKPADPFAFADFTWLNGSNRQKEALLDSKYFTGSFLIDVNYTLSAANPIDNTVVGSTTLSRNNEMTLQFMGFGGDFHWENTRARLMMQYGTRSVVVPRNDGSAMRGQFDLDTALRYVSEVNGGYHFDVWNGINVDLGIFMSYIGLFSYDNFENWAYLPSYTSDNTPWFFNGARIQIFPNDKLKIEPWIVNGWQTYGKFNEMPGFGVAIVWRPVEWFGGVSNNYVGWDTQDNPGRMRLHTDNSFLFRYHNNPNNKLIPKAAFSVTIDFGGEQGDGVTPFGGSGHEGSCTNATPCNQHFASWMAYNRIWFFDGLFALNVGGGMMDNPGRYLVLYPTGQASPIQTLSTAGVSYASPTAPFDTSAGTSFQAWDVMSGMQFMPSQYLTYGLEWSYRASSVPYFAGHGGVTSPDGYITTTTPLGWRADLRPNDLRLIADMLVRF
jgi:opacity protein-like surface antigen